MKQHELEIVALRQTLRDISNLIRKRQKENKKAKDTKFSVVIDGDEYFSENEVLDSYGGGFITESQKDIALKKFNDHQDIDDVKVNNIEIDWLSSMWEITNEKLNKVKMEAQNER